MVTIYTLTCTLEAADGVYIAIDNYSLPFYFYRTDVPRPDSDGCIYDGEKSDIFGDATFTLTGTLPLHPSDECFRFATQLASGTLKGHMFDKIGEAKRNEIEITTNYVSGQSADNWLTHYTELVTNKNLEAFDGEITTKNFMIASILSTKSRFHQKVLELANPHQWSQERKNLVNSYQTFDSSLISALRGEKQSLSARFGTYNTQLSVVVKKFSSETIKNLILMSNLVRDQMCQHFPSLFFFGELSENQNDVTYTEQYCPSQIKHNETTFIIINYITALAFFKHMNTGLFATRAMESFYALYCINYYLGINFIGQSGYIDAMSETGPVSIGALGQFGQIDESPKFDFVAQYQSLQHLYGTSIGGLCVWASFFSLLTDYSTENYNFALDNQKYMNFYTSRKRETIPENTSSNTDSPIIETILTSNSADEINKSLEANADEEITLVEIPQQISSDTHQPPLKLATGITQSKSTAPTFNVLFVHQNDSPTTEAAANMKKNVMEGYKTIQKMNTKKIEAVDLLITEKGEEQEIKSGEYDAIFYFVANRLVDLIAGIVGETTFIINVKNYKKSWRHALVGHDVNDVHNGKDYKHTNIDYWCKAKTDCTTATNNVSVAKSIGTILQRTAMNKQSMSLTQKAAYAAILVAFAGIIKCQLGFGGDCVTFLASSATAVMIALFGSKVFGYVRTAGNKLWGKLIGDPNIMQKQGGTVGK